MYTSSSYLDFETALSWPVYNKTRDSIQKVCSCRKIQFWIVECKREVKHVQFFGKIKKKRIIFTLQWFIRSSWSYLNLDLRIYLLRIIYYSIPWFNLGEGTIQIIKLLTSTFPWYYGTRNLSTLRIFPFFSNSAGKFSLVCLFSWWEVTRISLTFI